MSSSSQVVLEIRDGVDAAVEVIQVTATQYSGGKAMDFTAEMHPARSG